MSISVCGYSGRRFRRQGCRRGLSIGVQVRSLSRTAAAALPLPWLVWPVISPACVRTRLRTPPAFARLCRFCVRVVPQQDASKDAAAASCGAGRGCLSGMERGGAAAAKDVRQPFLPTAQSCSHRRTRTRPLLSCRACGADE